MRPGCKTLIRREPTFHDKFCHVKTRPHKKLMCSWNGGGGSGGGTGQEGNSMHGNHGASMSGFNGGIILAAGGPEGMSTIFDSGGNEINATGMMMEHTEQQHMHMNHPPHGVPGPIVGTGIPGLLAALLLIVARMRKQR